MAVMARDGSWLFFLVLRRSYLNKVGVCNAAGMANSININAKATLIFFMFFFF